MALHPPASVQASHHQGTSLLKKAILRAISPHFAEQLVDFASPSSRFFSSLTCASIARSSTQNNSLRYRTGMYYDVVFSSLMQSRRHLRDQDQGKTQLCTGGQASSHPIRALFKAPARGTYYVVSMREAEG
jgi:hypothetical protein